MAQCLANTAGEVVPTKLGYFLDDLDNQPNQARKCNLSLDDAHEWKETRVSLSIFLKRCPNLDLFNWLFLAGAQEAGRPVFFLSLIVPPTLHTIYSVIDNFSGVTFYFKVICDFWFFRLWKQNWRFFDRSYYLISWLNFYLNYY